MGGYRNKEGYPDPTAGEAIGTLTKEERREDIDKYIAHEDYGVIFYDNGNPDIVDIFEKYFDYAECGINEEMPDKEALPLMKAKIDTLDWVEAIIVNIVLPDPELC